MNSTILTKTIANDGGKWKRYLEYKDSGFEWLGEIPAGWDIRRLKYVAPVSNEKLNEKPYDLQYLGLEHVETKTGRILLDVPVENVDSNVSIFKKGDVLFGKLRPYLAKVVHVEFDGVCTTELLVLEPNFASYGHFLFYLLLSDEVISLVNSMTYGTKMPRANAEQISNIILPLPDHPEQHAIAAFLDRETAKIDALVEKKRRLIGLLKEKRAAIISHAVTKGLDPDAPMKDSGVEWLGEIPTGWTVKRIKFLTKCLDGQRIPLNSEERGEMQGEIPYWGANGILDHVDKWLFDEPLVLLGEDGAPFFDKNKNVAFFVSDRVWVNNHIHVLRPNKAIKPSLLTHCLNCVDYKNLALRYFLWVMDNHLSYEVIE